MCIRDRCSIAPGNPHGVAAPLAPLLRRAMDAGRVGASLYTCLLYTSDAADERSSVDLGGRRIIKKKKHRYTRLGGVRRSTTEHKHYVHRKNKKL